MIIEEQSGSSLHGHASLFGSWDIDIIERWIHDRTFRKQLVDLIDSIINCTIPNHVKSDRQHIHVLSSAPYLIQNLETLTVSQLLSIVA